MVQMRTWLTVADNSGARQLTAILPLGGDTGLVAGLGDVVTTSVKGAAPDSQVKKGAVVNAVLVRTCNDHRRRNGTDTRYDANSAVMFNEAGEYAGTRAFGPTKYKM